MIVDVADNKTQSRTLEWRERSVAVFRQRQLYGVSIRGR